MVCDLHQWRFNNAIAFLKLQQAEMVRLKML